MSFKHSKIENSPDFPYVQVTPPPLDDHGTRQLCWGPTPEDVVEYIHANQIADYPLEIAVGIMMKATRGKCNPKIVIDTLHEQYAAKLNKSLD
ncbi:hypothetical protein D3C80_1756260 [compost metagenome]